MQKDGGVAQELLDDAELFSGVIGGSQEKLGRKHRQAIEAPRLPAGVVGGGLLELEGAIAIDEGVVRSTIAR